MQGVTRYEQVRYRNKIQDYVKAKPSTPLTKAILRSAQTTGMPILRIADINNTRSNHEPRKSSLSRIFEALDDWYAASSWN